MKRLLSRDPWTESSIKKSRRRSLSRRPQTRSMSRASYVHSPTSPSQSRVELATYARAAKEEMRELLKDSPDLGSMSKSALLFSNFNFLNNGRHGRMDVTPILNKLDSRDDKAKLALINFLNEHSMDVIIQIHGKTDYRNLHPSDLGDFVDYGCSPRYDEDGDLILVECYFDFSKVKIQLSVPNTSRKNIKDIKKICELFEEIAYLQKN